MRLDSRLRGLGLSLLVIALGIAATGCEEDLAPQITKFDLDPTCDVITEHTRAILGPDGQPLLDEFGQPQIENLGSFLAVNYFGRATGGNRFDDPTGGNVPLEFTWNFGDGTTVRDRVTGVHKYETPGNFVVTLTVKDDDGQTASISETIIVGEEGSSVDVLSVDFEELESLPNVASESSTGSLFILDITNPAAPTVAGSVSLGSASTGVALNGDYAYVASGGPGLSVVDIASPSLPSFVTRIGFGDEETVDAVRNVAFDDANEKLYLAMSSSVALRMDTTIPDMPAIVDADTTLTGQPLALVDPEPISNSDISVLSDGRILMANGLGLKQLDFADVFLPPVDAGDPPRIYSIVSNGQASHVTIDGNFAYVADGTTGLSIFNISNPTTQFQTGWFGTAGTVVNVAVSGSTIYLADDLGGIYIVSSSGGGDPTQLGYINTPGRAKDLEVVGNTLYVANSGGLIAIDVTDSSAPAILGSVLDQGQGEAIAVNGNFAYVIVNGTFNGWTARLDADLATPCPSSGFIEQFTWSWDMGDGGDPIDHSSAPTRTYAAPGDYDVTVTVTEEQSGVRRSATHTITVPRF